MKKIRRGKDRIRPREKETHQDKNWQQYDIHQRAGRDAPKLRARALRWLHKSNAAKGPEQNAIGNPAD